MATVNVSTIAQLNTAIGSAASGDIIRVAGGVYGTFSRTTTTTFSKTNPLRIVANDPSNPPKFNGTSRGFQIANHTGIKFEGLDFIGTKDADGFANGTSTDIYNSHAITFEDCLWDWWNRAIVFGSGTGCSDITFRRCEWRHVSKDTFEFYKKVDGLLIENCWNYDAYVQTANDVHHNTGNHCDIIQFALNGSDPAGSNHVIRNNWLVAMAQGDKYSHGLFHYNERVNALQHTAAAAFTNNVEIANNYIATGHANAIAACGWRGNCSVHHNVIRALPAPRSSTPRFNVYLGVGQASNKVEVYNNVWPVGPAYMTNSSGVTANDDGINYSNNTVSNTAFPAGWVDFTYGRYSNVTTPVETQPTRMTIRRAPPAVASSAVSSGASGTAVGTPPTIGSVSSSWTSNAPTFTDYAAGDYIFAFAYHALSTAAIPLPAGWTEAWTADANPTLSGQFCASLLAYIRVPAGGAVTLPTWTGAAIVKYVRVSGASATAPVRQVNRAASASAPTLTNPALGNPLGAQSQVLTFAFTRLTTEGAGPGARTDCTTIAQRTAAGGTHALFSKATTPTAGSTWAAQEVTQQGGANSGAGHAWVVEIDGNTAGAGVIAAESWTNEFGVDWTDENGEVWTVSGSGTIGLSVDMPATLTPGQKVAVIVSMDGSPTLEVDTDLSSAGWTLSATMTQGSAVTQHIYFGEAPPTGTLSLVLRFSTVTAFTAIALGLSGAGAQIFVAQVAETAANSNPPSLTPAGGTNEYLVIAARSGDGAVVPTVGPATYSAVVNQAGDASSASTSYATTSGRITTVDPGAFTSAAAPAVSATIAVPPTIDDTQRAVYHGDIDGTYSVGLRDVDGVMLEMFSGLFRVPKATSPAWNVDSDFYDFQWRAPASGVSNWKPMVWVSTNAAGDHFFAMKPDSGYDVATPDETFPTAHRLHARLPGETMSDIRVRYKRSDGTLYAEETPYTMAFSVAGVQAITANPVTVAQMAIGSPAISQSQVLVAASVTIAQLQPNPATVVSNQNFAPVSVIMASPLIGQPGVTQAQTVSALPVFMARPVIQDAVIVQLEDGGTAQFFDPLPVLISGLLVGQPSITQRQEIAAQSVQITLPQIPFPVMTQAQAPAAQAVSIARPLISAAQIAQQQNLVAIETAIAEFIVGVGTISQSQGTANVEIAPLIVGAAHISQKQHVTAQTVTLPSMILGAPTIIQVAPDSADPWQYRDWRRHLRAVRREVHETMGVRAVYATSRTQPGRIVSVRPRFKQDTNDALGAVHHDADAKVLFDRSEVPTPMRNALIAFQSGEVYVICGMEAPYMGYVTCDVQPLSEAEASALWPIIVPTHF